MPSICYDLKRRHRFLCPPKEQEKEFYTREIFTLDQRQRPRKPGGADCITSGLPPKHPLSRKREEPNYKFHESTSQKARFSLVSVLHSFALPFRMRILMNTPAVYNKLSQLFIFFCHVYCMGIHLHRAYFHTHFLSRCFRML